MPGSTTVSALSEVKTEGSRPRLDSRSSSGALSRRNVTSTSTYGIEERKWKRIRETYLWDKEQSEKEIGKLAKLDDDEVIEEYKNNSSRDLLYRIEWKRRFDCLTRQVSPPNHGGKHPFCLGSIPAARRGFLKLAQWGTFSHKMKALKKLGEIVSFDPCLKQQTADDLLELEEDLVKLLDLSWISKRTMDQQRAFLKVFGDVTEAHLFQFRNMNFNAMQKEDQDAGWDAPKELEDLNKHKDHAMRFRAWYAVECIRRVATHGRWMDWLPVGQDTFEMLFAIASLYENPGAIKEVSQSFISACQHIEKALEHCGSGDACHETLMALRKQIKNSLGNMRHFKQIKNIVHNAKVKQEKVDKHLLYGILEFLGDMIMSPSAKDPIVVDQALKLIVQYGTIKHKSIQIKVVDVLEMMLKQTKDEKLSFTAKLLIDILHAGKWIESSEAASQLIKSVQLGKQIHGRERKKLEKLEWYENVVKSLLCDVADIRKDEGYSGISLANLLVSSQKDNIPELLQCLAQEPGFNIFEPDIRGNTPYHLAKNEKVLQALYQLESGKFPDPSKFSSCMNQADNQGETPLHRRARDGSKAIAEFFVQHGASLSCVDRNGKTPLSLAIDCKNFKVIDVLLPSSVQVSKEYSEMTPWTYVAREGNQEVLEYLLRRSDPVSFIDVSAIQDMLIGHDCEEESFKLKCSESCAQAHLDRMERDPEYREMVSMFDWRFTDQWKVVRSTSELPPAISAAQEGEFVAPKDNEVDSKKNTVFHYAVENSGEDGRNLVRKFLESKSWGLNEPNTLGMTPLHHAILFGRDDIANLLIAGGALVNKKDEPLGLTPLHLAAYLQNKDLVELLSAKGAHVNEKSGGKMKLTPLHLVLGDVLPRSVLSMTLLRLVSGSEIYSKEGNEEEIVKVLLNANADPSLKDEGGNTAVHHAARCGFSAVVKLLRDRVPKACFYESNEIGYMPIYYAFHSRDKDTASEVLLLEKDLKQFQKDFRVKTQGRLTLANMAAETGQSDVLDKLLNADLEQLNSGADNSHFGMKPLHVACDFGELDAVNVCLKARKKDKGYVNGEDRFQQRPLHLAAAKGDTKVITELINAGADVSVRNQGGSTPLHVAAAHGHLGAVKLLIEKGAKPTSGDGNANKPLHSAASHGHLGVVKHLAELYSEADIKFLNDDGKTAFHSACLSGQVEVAEYLLAEMGADPHARDYSGQAPLHLCAEVGEVDLAKLFWPRGVDSAAKADRGLTPLHKAVSHGNRRFAKALIKYDTKNRPIDENKKAIGLDDGPLVCIVDDDGESPLHKVVRSSHSSEKEQKKMAAFLLKKGALVNCRDKRGRTPLHLAAIYGNLKLVKLFTEHGLKKKKDRTKRTERAEGVDHLHKSPVHYACEKGHDEVVSYLLKQGVEIKNQANENKKARFANRFKRIHDDLDSPLFAAIRGGYLNVVQTLLKHRKKVTKHKDRLGGRALHVLLGQPEVSSDMIQALIQADPKLILQKDAQKNTPLHVAGRQGYVQSAKLLLDCLDKVYPKRKSKSIGKRRKYRSQVNNSGETAIKTALNAGKTGFHGVIRMYHPKWEKDCKKKSKKAAALD